MKSIIFRFLRSPVQSFSFSSSQLNNDIVNENKDMIFGLMQNYKIHPCRVKSSFEMQHEIFTERK